jgi:diguanylate cyclase (GGDEF)-like protein
MATVRQIMAEHLVTARPDDSVAYAARKMEEARVGGLPVVETDGSLVGIITSRDVRRAHPNRLVADAMTREVVTIASSASVWEARDLLKRYKVERLPVLEQGHLTGIVGKSEVLMSVGRLTDDLTGLPTSGYLRHIGETLLAADAEICMVFFDINNFGELNKRLGHNTGDAVLQHVTRVLSEACIQSLDFPCRYGGDEFAVVTLRSAEDADEYARRVIGAVAAESANGWQVSLSAGVAGGQRRAPRAQRLAETVENLIGIASRASTEAKRIQAGVLHVDLAS